MSSSRRLRKSIRGSAPGLEYERHLWESGRRVVAGIDEVGKGAWAGPLTLVAAVVPTDRRIYKVRDSKMLTEPERERLFDRVAAWCVDWAVGSASNSECDELGMSEAQRLAARRALGALREPPDHVLIDGNWDFVGDEVGSENVTKIVKGDAKCLSIAAASVLAKVVRDREIREGARSFPEYMLEENKGYPCPRHRAALADWGPCSLHRRSWAFMDALRFEGVSRFVRADGAQPELF